MDREKQFLELVQRFPTNPMGHFSLGKLYLEQRRYQEGARALEEATRLDPEYAAAWVALGEAYASQGKADSARTAYQSALSTAHGRRDASLAADLDRRLAEL